MALKTIKRNAMSAKCPMCIERVDPADPQATRLIALSDAYLMSLYPAESNHLTDIVALQQPDMAFFGGYVDQRLVACGAIRLVNNDGTYAEVKRVFVDAPYRGKGLSKAIMAHLEQYASSLGIETMRLETGIYQPEALGLYARLGYLNRKPFGTYKVDPLSVFMEKRIMPFAEVV